jgi:hypothetical protein
MWYQITFFKLKITAADWDKFFVTIGKYGWQFPLEIKIGAGKLEFWLKTRRKLEVINYRLYPFNLVAGIPSSRKLKNKQSRVRWPLLSGDNLTKLIENRQLKNLSPILIKLKISRLRLNCGLHLLRLVLADGGQQLVCQGGNWANWLSFDLTQTINLKIAKVKPKLVMLDRDLNLQARGIIESKSFPAQNQLSTQNFDFARHGLIVGQSGCGKSCLINLLLEDLYRLHHDDYAVIVLDPHASIQVSAKLRPVTKVINFDQEMPALFASTTAPVQAAELALDLFSSVLPVSDQPNLWRLLKFSCLFLFSVKLMSFENLRLLLTDSLWRKEKLKLITKKSIQDFFATEYQKIYTSEYNTAVLPILNVIAELDFGGEGQKELTLTALVKEHFLTVLPLAKNRFGARATKIIAGTIISQIFMLAGENKFKKKVILIIDELALVQNPALVSILAEARKFGLTLILSQQYLLQISAELMQSVLANVVNYFVFKVSRGDAQILAENINLKVEPYFLQNKNDPRESLELGTKFLTELSTRELVVRVMANEQYLAPFLGKTVALNQESSTR